MLTYRKLHRFTLNLVNGESHALLVDHVYAENEGFVIVAYALIREQVYALLLKNGHAKLNGEKVSYALPTKNRLQSN